MGKKEAQIWVETVIYTLIFLVLIGLILAYVKPKIEEITDKSLIGQSVEMMKEIDNVILSIVRGGPGNKRKIEINLNKGALTIDSVNNKIIFEMDSKYTYTEPGKDVEIGRINARTEKLGKLNKVYLTLNYDYNITYEGNKDKKSITKAPTPYKLFITHKGGDPTNLDFEIK